MHRLRAQRRTLPRWQPAQAAPIGLFVPRQAEPLASTATQTATDRQRVLKRRLSKLPLKEHFGQLHSTTPGGASAGWAPSGPCGQRSVGSSGTPQVAAPGGGAVSKRRRVLTKPWAKHADAAGMTGASRPGGAARSGLTSARKSQPAPAWRRDRAGQRGRSARARSAVAVAAQAHKRGRRAKRVQREGSTKVALAPPPAKRARPDPLPRHMAVEVSQAAREADEAGRRARESLALPARPGCGFSSRKARQGAWAEQMADALLAMLPPEAISTLEGGEGGRAQVPAADRGAAPKAALLRKAGADGTTLREAAKALAYVRAFTSSIGVVAPFAGDGVRAPLSALMVRAVHQRAVREGVGSRGGATVGDNFRNALWTLAECGCPIHLDDPAVEAAAPRPKQGGGRRSTAATPPLKLLFHLRDVAAREVSSPVRFYARSLLLAILNGVRVADGLDFRLWLDPVDPDGVVRGQAVWKDGEPIALYAPASVGGERLGWLREHVADATRLGQTFPDWTGPYGCRKHMDKATELLSTVATEAHVRGAFAFVMGMQPLGWSAGRLALLGVRGHSIHLMLADISRLVGRNPTVPFALSEALRPGFDKTDRRVFGHWLRDPFDEDGDDLDKSQAGRAAQRAAGQQARSDCDDQYTRGEGRVGERAEQLETRSRLDDWIARAVRHDGRPWTAWPAGRADLAILRPGASVE
jgi:hypothetical protein